MPDQHVPGFLAVIREPGSAEGPAVAPAIAAVGVANAAAVHLPNLQLATWGLGAERPTADLPLLLSGTNWSDNGPVSAPHSVSGWPPLPPTHLHRCCRPSRRWAHAAAGSCWSPTRWVSGSCSAGGAQVGSGCRPPPGHWPLWEKGVWTERALLLQSLLGWQLGQRTLFEGVTKLAPGEWVQFTAGTINEGVAETVDAGPVSIDAATTQAAALLRSFSSATWTNIRTRPFSSPAVRTPAWCSAPSRWRAARASG